MELLIHGVFEIEAKHYERSAVFNGLQGLVFTEKN